MNYPEYLVDMMYDYLKLKETANVDLIMLQSLLYSIEFEVELHEAAVMVTAELPDRSVGWYCDLVKQVNDKYNKRFLSGI